MPCYGDVAVLRASERGGSSTWVRGLLKDIHVLTACTPPEKPRWAFLVNWKRAACPLLFYLPPYQSC